MTQLESLVEGFCQYVWSGFTDVSNVEETHRVLDCLESANVAAEQGLKGRAMHYISDAVERVFGASSYDYREFMRLYFPEDLAWREYIERENPPLGGVTMTQDEARSVLEKVRQRAIQLRKGENVYSVS